VRYHTAVGLGVLTGIVTAMLWIIIRIVLPIIVAPLAVSQVVPDQSGSGGTGDVVGLESILLSAFVGVGGGVGGMLWRR
jgi:hypothetical protein